MRSSNNGLRFEGTSQDSDWAWSGPKESIAYELSDIRNRLLDLDRVCYIVRENDRIGVTCEGCAMPATGDEDFERLMSVPSVSVEQLGDPDFLAFHGAKYPYYAGSMANGISSEEMVIALGRERILSGFGASGLLPSQIESAIHHIQERLPSGPYAFCLIHSPGDQALERKTVDLYLKHGITTVEASAFLDLTPHIVRYRAAGLRLSPKGRTEIGNKIIAKISRREIATKFMHPAPAGILGELVAQGGITDLQARLAESVPMADDMTVEADSAGHTDNRPLVCLLPSVIALRDEIQEKTGYEREIRVGAAGGIGTPQAALGAFMMGAAYVVTGSVNQSCVEAGTSQHTRELLAQAEMADVMMAPSADMFEMGVKVQVLKRGSLFPMRAQKLYDLYRNHHSIEEIPVQERKKIERQIFKQNLDAVWERTVRFFTERDPEQIRQAAQNPRRKMALIFRWYLGLASHWANTGEKGREMDYQIWCGPAMGAFNDWMRGAYLAGSDNRRVVDVARHILTGAAYLYRVQSLRLRGLCMSAAYSRYCPMPFDGAS